MQKTSPEHESLHFTFNCRRKSTYLQHDRQLFAHDKAWAMAFASLLVLQATDRAGEIFVAVAQERTLVAAVHVHVAGGLSVFLSSTPEEGRTVSIVEAENVAPIIASGQRGKAVGIRSFVTANPPGRGPENRDRFVIATHCREQGLPFAKCRQVPATWANASNRVWRPAYLFIAAALAVRAPCANTIHSCSPGIKATVVPVGAVEGFTVGTVAACRFVVEVLGHPYLRTDGHRLVGLSIATIRQGSVFNEA